MSAIGVFFILGPTGVGKSALAAQACEQFGGGVLNCDSIQAYTRVQVGAAKPSLQERQRFPHYLFDWVQPGQTLTAADFRREALKIIPQALTQGPLWAVGGSGFYVQALEKGMYPVGKVSADRTEHYRCRLREEGSEALHEELRRLDPEYAEQIKPRDGYRITRALVLIESEGRRMSEILREFASRPKEWAYPTCKIGLELPRGILRDRVQARTRQMLADGLVDEVKALLADGLRDWWPLKSVGYRECVEMLQGQWPESELESKITQATMVLAKKQMTWFKRDQEIRWFDVQDGFSEALQYLQDQFTIKSLGESDK